MNHARARLVPPLVLALALAGAAGAVAGSNPGVTLPLHARSAGGLEPCTGYFPVDCLGTRPTVDIAPGPITVFLLVANHSQVAGVQTAFEIPPGWMFTFALWDCLPGQIAAVTPRAPFGSAAGTITTAFNPVSGPTLAAVGRLHLTAGAFGCLAQVQSSYPFGTHVIDARQDVDEIPAGARLGRICVASGGIDACVGQPLEAATWGRIKTQF